VDLLGFLIVQRVNGGVINQSGVDNYRYQGQFAEAVGLGKTRTRKQILALP